MLPLLRALARAAETYVCPMHPDVKSATAGKCPRCGMTLRAEGSSEVANEGSAIQIPDVVVRDQTGRTLRFYTDLMKGKTVAIDFIFTTCTTTCPLLSANFRKVQEGLAGSEARDVQLISISVDPLTDIPERLQAFAAQFHAAPGWTFVTGTKQEIDRLLRALGASVADKNDHTLRILIGNEPLQYWRRLSGLESPVKILAAIKEIAQLAYR